MGEQIISNEDYTLQEEEIIQDSQESSQTQAIIAVRSEEIDINSSFFMGVQISGIMCLLSLGIAIIIRMFRQAV